MAAVDRPHAPDERRSYALAWDALVARGVSDGAAARMVRDEAVDCENCAPRAV